MTDGLTCQPDMRRVSDSQSLFLCVEPGNHKQKFRSVERS